MSDSLKDLANDDATREAAIEAAKNPTRDTAIAVLAAAATAAYGPVAGLAIRYGASAAIAAIANRRGKRADEMTEAEWRLTATELLSEPTFEEQAEQARKAAVRRLEAATDRD